ncbi:MAG: Uxx-star family glutaredoxin-like (seleno)protein [Candidatus Dormibacteria bacterium]
MPLELYGTRSCPYTAELRDELEWQGREFVEFDVDADGAAMRRMLELTGGTAAVPVLVEDGTVRQTGYGGRSCYLAAPPAAQTSTGKR